MSPDLTDYVAHQYDLFQTSLEKMDKERKYLNYGYTVDRLASYEERQERLCREVFDAADLQMDDTVVDVGFGSGEQDFLLERNYAFHDLHGFNISKAQVDYAQARARAEGLEGKLHFWHGEAEALPGIKANSVDKLLAVECAFYFNRARFYRRAAEVLKPGGRLVAADIMFPDRMVALTRRSEDLARVGTMSGNERLWAPYFATVEIRAIHHFTRPGAQMTVGQILETVSTEGLDGRETRQWLKMAFYTQLVVIGLLTRQLRYDLIVLEARFPT